MPDFVRNSPLGNDFDVALPEYSGSLWSPSTVETSARQIQTFIQTRFPNHDPVFIIGYSLGGLVARELSRQLLVSGPDELLNKIPAVITMGTPLEGASFGNFILRFVWPLSKKIRQLASPRYAFDEYRHAIRGASNRNVRRPKQLHIQFEDDRVIKGHIESHFTEDDIAADVVPGGHTNFAERNSDASYVAEVILRQLRKAHIAVSRPNIKAPEPVAGAELPDRLVLIACSHAKRDGGDSPFAGPAPVGWIPQRGLRQRVISKSSYVYSLIHDAKLADGFKRGENRAHQAANRNLKHGPDLGGVSVTSEEGTYRPAWQRYNGRFYGPVTADAWRALPEARQSFRILIMSGLYGLIEPEEWIQNYDVHLTDSNEDNGQSVSSMWTELFTECIDTYIRHSYRDRKVKIFNLLCDRYYVAAVQWHALSRNCSVFHLTSPTLSDVQLFPPAGLILNSFLLDPGRLEEIDPAERDMVRYPLSNFGAPPAGLAGTEIMFESRVGVGRQGDDAG